jgi:hypothetical protein
MSETLAGTQLAKLQLGEPILECFYRFYTILLEFPSTPPLPPFNFLFGFETDRSRQTHAFTKFCQCQRLVSTKASCWAVISVVCATLGEGGRFLGEVLGLV